MKTTCQVANIIALFYLLIASQPAIAGPFPVIDGLVSPYNSQKCIECHDDTAEALAQSSHSQSVTSPAVVIMLKDIIMKSPKTEQVKTVKACLSCHAPQVKDALDEQINLIAKLIVSASDNKNTVRQKASEKALSGLNINCRICHMYSAQPQKILTPGIIYGPGWDEHEHSHMEEFEFDTIKSDYLISSSFCIGCHTLLLPDFLPSEYSSMHKGLENHPDQGKDKTCHQCHTGTSGHTFAGVNEPSG